MRRIGTVEDIASLVRFLCRRAATTSPAPPSRLTAACSAAFAEGHHELRQHDQAELAQPLHGAGLGPARPSSSSRAAAAAHPDREVFADAKRRITYGALKDEILRCAELYRRIGIKRGDVVTIQLPNRIEFAVVFFALELIGAIANKVNPDFRARELEYILKFSGSSAYVFPREFRDFDYVSMAKCLQHVGAGLAHLIVAGGAADGATASTSCAMSADCGRAPGADGPERDFPHGLHLRHDRRSEMRAALVQHHALRAVAAEPRHEGDRARRPAHLPAGRSELGLHHADANHHGRRARRFDGAVLRRAARWN